VLYRVRQLPERLLHEDVFYHVLGHLIGLDVRDGIPVIEGLPATVSEDRLKAFGAAAASSGAVSLFHAVGRTTEAPTLDAAFHGRGPGREVDITTQQLAEARDSLTTSRSSRLAAVSLGTQHFSLQEFAQLVSLLDDIRIQPGIDFYVSTGRDVLAEVSARGWLSVCEAAGITIVVDTCTYITPILRATSGAVMTNSAKWAYYAPGNVGVEVIFGSMRECVESAAQGVVWRDPELWSGL